MCVKSTRKERYKNFSPILLVLFPLIVGLYFTIGSIIAIVSLILDPYSLEGIEIGGLLFIFIVIVIIFAFGLKGINEAIDEYWYQKEYNIKWRRIRPPGAGRGLMASRKYEEGHSTDNG
jgi:hypothetical protein